MVASPSDPNRKLGLADAYALKTPADNRELYRDWAATYESEFIEARGYVYHEQVAQLFVDALRVSAVTLDAAVLDVGCGTGIVGVALADRGCATVDGIDISLAMLDQARTKAVYRSLLEADLTQPTHLVTSAYGGVISVGAFTHGHLGPEPIAELVRVTSPGGVLAIGINGEHYESLGFGRFLTGLVDRGLIREPVMERARIYTEADDEWADDLATVAMLTRTG